MYCNDRLLSYSILYLADLTNIPQLYLIIAGPDTPSDPLSVNYLPKIDHVISTYPELSLDKKELISMVNS